MQVVPSRSPGRVPVSWRHAGSAPASVPAGATRAHRVSWRKVCWLGKEDCVSHGLGACKGKYDALLAMHTPGSDIPHIWS
jgi:hypothetical protein